MERRIGSLETEHAHTRAILDMHVTECGAANSRTAKALDRLNDAIEHMATKVEGAARRIHSRIDHIVWSAGGTFIGALAAALGWLLTHWRPA